MAVYNERILRENVSVPVETVNEIIQELPGQSVALSRMRQVRMSSKTRKQNVLASLPAAYWVDGDTGLKQTTKATWDNIVMTAEELAALVPVPNAVIDDSDMPIWELVKPLLVEAIGNKLDLATLFGIDKPTTWPTALVPAAIAAGNTVAEGTGADFGVDVASLAGMIAKDGFAVNGFASAPGLNWKLIGLRDGNERPIYGNPMAVGQPGTLYGYPLHEVTNGAWQANAAELIAADWSKFVVGVRQDITFDLFDQMVISDDDGKVIFNAPQQDSKVLRVVFRVGYQVANPLTRTNQVAATRYPAGVLTPAAGPGGDPGDGGEEGDG